jgi:DNA-binding NarL/FixJ family response regulator
LSQRGLAEHSARPKPRVVTNPILAASEEPFRNRVLERLLAAGVDDLQVADLPGALADLLRGAERSVVVVGGEWDATRPFLRVAVNSGALPVVLFDSSAVDAEGEALAMGARATLQSDIAVASLAAALTAVDAGLMVLEPSARAILQTRRSAGMMLSDRETGSLRRTGLRRETGSPRDTEHVPPRRAGRPLTTREREILSLVASGTSNKGVARALGVSANTVKFHLAAVFDKLNAATRAEAVAEAIRRGEISL